ncbi:DDHD domain-containing protein [Hyaloraphidium curvatum]|nr:DDHD domain-containing protein [Hyaloraphidium curvatum]
MSDQSPPTQSPGSPLGSLKPVPDALVFLVHGMGQQNNQIEQYGNFHNNLKDVRENAVSRLKELYPDRDLRVDIVGIEWHSSFHAGEGGVDRRMELVTLPNIPSIRLVMNGWLSDVCYYYTPAGGQISAIVAGLINSHYQEFRAEHPSFSGPVCIIGHSLGGVICFDLLTHHGRCSPVSCPGPPSFSVDDVDVEHPYGSPNSLAACHPHIHSPFLDFTPSYFFTLGAPIGAVHVQRNASFRRTFRDLPCPMVNIFQSHDPFGYRIEPLLSAEYAKVPPVTLEAAKPAPSQELVPAGGGSSLRDFLTITVKMPDFLSVSLPRLSFPLSGMQVPSITLPSFSLPSGGGRTNVHLEVDYQIQDDSPGETGDTGKRKRDSGGDESTSVPGDVEAADPSAAKRTRRSVGTSNFSEEGVFTRIGSFMRSSFSSFSSFRAVVVSGSEAAAAATISPLSEDLTSILVEAGIDAKAAVEPSVDASEPAAQMAQAAEPAPAIEPPSPRLDYTFVAQQSYLDAFSANEYLKGIKGHFTYWRSKEAMTLMMRTVAGLIDGPSCT